MDFFTQNVYPDKRKIAVRSSPGAVVFGISALASRRSLSHQVIIGSSLKAPGVRKDHSHELA